MALPTLGYRSARTLKNMTIRMNFAYTTLGLATLSEQSLERIANATIPLLNALTNTSALT